MPIISRFLGIIITMYWSDLAPPHFHAKYGEYEIIVSIEGGIIEGKFPKRALQHVLEWLDLHQQALLENWQRCQNRQPLLPVQPLE